MLKQILIFCFLIGMTNLTQAQHLQLLDNRGEFGLYRGQSSYRGDIAPDVFKFNKNLSFEIQRGQVPPLLPPSP